MYISRSLGSISALDDWHQVNFFNMETKVDLTTSLSNITEVVRVHYTHAQSRPNGDVTVDIVPSSVNWGPKLLGDRAEPLIFGLHMVLSLDCSCSSEQRSGKGNVHRLQPSIQVLNVLWDDT